MKFTKEEINLCKQIAEKHREKNDKEAKELKVGLYIWQEFSKSVQIIYRLDEKEKDIYTIVPKTGSRKLLYWNNLEGGWLTPLWTISDCLEFLEKKGLLDDWSIDKEWDEDANQTGNICFWWKPSPKGKDRYTLGKTPREACLKAVLAVLEEAK